MRTHWIFTFVLRARCASWVVGVPTLLAAATWSGCGPSGSGGGGGEGEGGGGNGRPTPLTVTQENLVEFAERFDETAASAARAVVAALPAESASVRSAAGHRAVHQAFAGVVGAGASGRALGDGLRLLQRRPERYEMRLTLEGYSLAGAEEGLIIDGVLDYNFILDETGGSVLEGLYRGHVTVSGTYTGESDIEAAVIGGRVTAFHVNAEGAALAFGADLPPFLAHVSTIAGNGQAGNQDGIGAQALFDSPTGVAVDDEGLVYVADQGNGAIREIDLDGLVSTVTSDLEEPYDVGFDSLGLLVVSDQLGGSHGGEETPLLRLAVRGDGRGSIAPIIKGAENHWDSDFPLCPIGQYSCDGRSPLAALPWATGIDVQNLSVLVAEWALRPSLHLVLPDGFAMTVLDMGTGTSTSCDETHPGGPRDVVLGNRGEIYFTTDCHVVRVFEPDGQVRTLAGRLQTTLEFADGVGEAARFAYPEGLAFDGAQYLFVADYTNSLIRRVDIETGETVRVAGCLADTPGFECAEDFGFRDGSADYAQFNGPNNIAIDRWGDLYVADERNHAIRFIRIIADPQRTPSVHHFDPAVAQQGDSATLTITGRNLTTAQTLELGAGVTAELEQAGYQRLTARVIVAPDAAPGPRTLTVATSYGSIRTPSDLSFTVLADRRGGTQVETIAGTGAAEPDRLNYGPAQNTTFAFPGGMHAISADRLLVADPVEQRIRLIATRVGAVEEFFELLVYAATGSDTDVLGGILGVFDSVEHVLSSLGLGSGIVGQTEDALRDIARSSVDEICDTIGAEDCRWLSLPWAGAPYVPGEKNGFRLSSTFFLPTDIWSEGSGLASPRFYIADAGNRTIRVIGYDVEQQQDAPMQVFSTDAQPDYPFSVVPLGTSVFASLPASLMLSQLSLRSGAVNGDWAALPRGVPLGTATGAGDFSSEDRSIFVADPLNATIWRVVDHGGVADVRNLRGDVPAFVIGKCADGPATFATWGAPMDVAVDQTGTVYVADCGCNSIRVIKDLGFGQDLDGLVGELRGFVASNQSRISAAAAQAIEENLRLLDTDFLDANRFWVTTLAGSTDGEAGFSDGPAATARFNAPTSIALASDGENTIVFVADTGNRRIRRIVVP